MRKILGAIRRADNEYNLIDDGDKIAVGLSGGKDSMLLLRALSLYKHLCKKQYELSAICVDLGFSNYNIPAMQEYANSLNIPLNVVPTEIAQIVFDIRKEKNPCSLCSKMRKGALYSKANELNCNKVAFGHHGDDVVETFLMSLMYEGRVNTFSPKSYLSRTDITLIRPLVMLREKDILTSVARNNIPTAKNPCPIDFATKRQQTKDLIKKLDSENPNSSDNILHGICTTNTYNLWDKDFKNLPKE